MAVPKKRKTSSKTRAKRSGRHLVDTQSIIIDKKNGEFKRNHQIGPDGMYNGIQIIVKNSKNKKES